MLLFLILNSCTTTPKFQKNSDGVGYAIEDLEVKNSFRIVVQLPASDVTDLYVTKYAFRAAAEECLTRGLEYFDFSDKDSLSEFYGFCHSSKISHSLAITFKNSGLESAPRQFVVESLNNKTATNLKIGDEVLSLNGVEAKKMWQFKYFVFTAADKNMKSIQLQIKRDGVRLSVAEPLAELSGYLYSKENLEALRKSVK